MLFKSDVYAMSKHLMKSSQKGENVDLAKIMNFSKSEYGLKSGEGVLIQFNSLQAEQ